VADTRPRHLHEVDVVRIVTFGAVIAVHAIAFTERPANQVAAGALMLLQFGRELFFALMGFVLVYSAQRRYPGARAFWRRRFLFVAAPYVAWSAIYWFDDAVRGQHPNLVSDLLTGSSEYHLYFLLVTMQLYLAFPLLLAFVRRTASHAWTVLGVTAVLNVAWLAALHSVVPPAGWAGWVWTHAYQLLPTYSLYVLAGCYAAVRLPEVQHVVRARWRALVAVAVGAAGVALVAYVVQLPTRAPRDAADVLQPATALSCLAAILALFVAGSRWAAGPRRREALVREMSDISFGVYLAHPLVLQLLLDGFGLGNGNQRVPAPLATLLAFAGAAAGAAVVTLAARRTPLSLALTGRARRRPAAVPADLSATSDDPLGIVPAPAASLAS
jgi:peptidoglycan/LPS O-acetylase OafA/YrhL